MATLRFSSVAGSNYNAHVYTMLPSPPLREDSWLQSSDDWIVAHSVVRRPADPAGGWNEFG